MASDIDPITNHPSYNPYSHAIAKLRLHCTNSCMYDFVKVRSSQCQFFLQKWGSSLSGKLTCVRKVVNELVSGVICLPSIRWWLTKPNETSMSSVQAMSIEYIIVMAHFFSQQLSCCHNCILASTALMNRGKIDNKWTQHIQFQGPPMRCYHHYRIIEINYQMVKKYHYINTHTQK